MKKILLIVSIIVIIVLCSLFIYENNNTKVDKKVDNIITNDSVPKYQYDEIVNRHIETKNNEIADINFRFFDKKNILVETRYNSGFNEFDFYDLEIEDHQKLASLPTTMEFYKYINKNEIVFLSNGKSTVTNELKFPYIIKYVRDGKSKYQFITEPYFVELNKSVNLGLSEDSAIVDEILITKDGINIIFKSNMSNKNKTLKCIPFTQTYYTYGINNNAESKKLVFEFKNTQFNKNIDINKINYNRNHFIKNVDVISEKEDCLLIIYLNENTNKYNVNINAQSAVINFQ